MAADAGDVAFDRAAAGAFLDDLEQEEARFDVEGRRDFGVLFDFEFARPGGRGFEFAGGASGRAGAISPVSSLPGSALAVSVTSVP